MGVGYSESLKVSSERCDMRDNENKTKINKTLPYWGLRCGCFLPPQAKSVLTLTAVVQASWLRYIQPFYLRYCSHYG